MCRMRREGTEEEIVRHSSLGLVEGVQRGSKTEEKWSSRFEESQICSRIQENSTFQGR